MPTWMQKLRKVTAHLHGENRLPPQAADPTHGGDRSATALVSGHFSPGGGEGLSAENYEAQASALSVKSAAGEFSPSQEAMNPKVSEPPAGTVRL